MMTRGKSICNTLKDIRKQIAKANEIKYEPRECHHKGECLGTCPACEAEVKYIERQLDIRRQLGKAVALVGISAGLSALSASAQPVPTSLNPKVQKCDSSFRDQPLMVGRVPKMPMFGDVQEQMPAFPGGQKALMEYLAENIHYTDEMVESCTQGRVVITFVVEKDGSITKAEVVKGIDPAFDEEALRVVKSMPKWIPGKLNGEPVRTKYTVPINFRSK